MKRILSLVLCAAILLSTSIVPLRASAAEEFTEGYYTYETYEGRDGEGNITVDAVITDVDESISGDITIPATLGGYPVTAIDWDGSVTAPA